jgi:urease accessory protein UreF
MTKKKVIAVIVTTLALTAGSIGVAGAASKASHKDGVSKIHTEADHAAMKALISTTIGVDSATVKSRLKAGESLAQIAGAKKDALIAAMVAEKTKHIDAAVTAGKLTAAQATEKKAKLVAHVTEEVNEVGGKGHKGGRGGHGHDHRGPKGGGMGGAKAPTLPTPTATTGA